MAITLDGIGLLQVLFLIALGASAVFYVIELYSAAQFFRFRGLAESPYRPAVTVLKPLKGLDIELHQNLVSLCQQRYSAPLQLLFGVADPDDPAIAVVQQLQREFPRLDIELVVDGRVYGTNYKVSNLHNMYRRAKHDVIVLADSDIRVSPNWVNRVVEPLQDRRTGLVTCLYRAINTGGLPTVIESLFVNTDFAALVMLARKVEKSSYAFGATIAMRRAVLDEIGGFLPIVNLLADDYEIGYRVSQRGYRLELSPEVVDTVLAVGSWRRLIDHQLRWARTYRINRPGGYFGSILTHGTFWAVLNLLYNGFSAASCAASGIVIGLRYLVAARLLWTHLASDISIPELLLVGPKDLLLTGVWFAAFLSNQVVWSGHRFQVQQTGEMVDLSDAVQPTSEADAGATDTAERHVSGKR